MVDVFEICYTVIVNNIMHFMGKKDQFPSVNSDGDAKTAVEGGDSEIAKVSEELLALADDVEQRINEYEENSVNVPEEYVQGFAYVREREIIDDYSEDCAFLRREAYATAYEAIFQEAVRSRARSVRKPGEKDDEVYPRVKEELWDDMKQPIIDEADRLYQEYQNESEDYRNEIVRRRRDAHKAAVEMDNAIVRSLHEESEDADLELSESEQREKIYDAVYDELYVQPAYRLIDEIVKFGKSEEDAKEQARLILWNAQLEALIEAEVERRMNE